MMEFTNLRFNFLCLLIIQSSQREFSQLLYELLICLPVLLNGVCVNKKAPKIGVVHLPQTSCFKSGVLLPTSAQRAVEVHYCLQALQPVVYTAEFGL